MEEYDRRLKWQTEFLEEAVSKAIQQMGDPYIIGRQFHQMYKPRTEWSLIGMVLTFI